MDSAQTQFSSDIPHILQALKKLLKKKGLRYQDVADALKVSKVTVRRYLSGRGLTVDALERLCSVLGITLADLIDVVRDSRMTNSNHLTPSQEDTLVAEPFLVVLFTLLMRGWSPGQLQTEFDLTESELNGYLLKLDRLKLIELHPFGRVRLLIGQPYQVAPRGPLIKGFNRYIRDDLYKVDVMGPEVAFQYTYLKVSSATRQHLTKMLGDLLVTAEQMSAADRNLPKDVTSWQNLFILMSPTDLRRLASHGGSILRAWRRPG